VGGLDRIFDGQILTSWNDGISAARESSPEVQAAHKLSRSTALELHNRRRIEGIFSLTNPDTPKISIILVIVNRLPRGQAHAISIAIAITIVARQALPNRVSGAWANVEVGSICL